MYYCTYMNIELKERVSRIKLWSTPLQKRTYLEGLSFCRILLKYFLFRTSNLIGYREIFFLKRHPELIPEEWWGKRVYAFNPRSLKKCRYGFANVFCLNLLIKNQPRIQTHTVITTWFTFKDHVGYIPE